jgi:hypothetical protein
MSSASRLSDLLEMHHRRATKQSEGLSPLACCELQFDMSSCRAHVGSPVGQRITGDGQGDLPSPWRLLAQRPGAARNGMVQSRVLLSSAATTGERGLASEREVPSAYATGAPSPQRSFQPR